jgi:hypothetical protein
MTIKEARRLDSCRGRLKDKIVLNPLETIHELTTRAATSLQTDRHRLHSS